MGFRHNVSVYHPGQKPMPTGQFKPRETKPDFMDRAAQLGAEFQRQLDMVTCAENPRCKTCPIQLRCVL